MLHEGVTLVLVGLITGQPSTRKSRHQKITSPLREVSSPPII